MEHSATSNVVVQPADRSKILGIWKIALILFVITAVEYVFAFTMGAGLLRSSIFVALTLVKAFFIVSEFMHLGHEVKGLVYSIILPMIFIVWLIIALVKLEGRDVKESRGTQDYEPTGTEHVESGHH